MDVSVPSINPFGLRVKMAPIDGFDGYYISDHGDVWSARQSGRWLKPHLTECGYHTVGIRKNNVRMRVLVHRLVALAFIPNPLHFPQVNHKDECKTNNTIDNLEWCTARYNSNYGTRNKRIRKPVINMDTLERFESTIAAAKATGISESSICEVCKHKPKRYTAGGFHWAYESEVS
jgi:hypothetical protein